MAGQHLELSHREIPQLLGMETAEPYTDLHHIIPCDYFFFVPSLSLGMAFWKACMMRS